ncbi:hypothetical protein [Martelella sp. FOR1707]
MTRLSQQQRDELIRATDRARQYLREGDRITFSSCPGTKRWGVFVGFSGECVVTKTRDDISARSISKVNGLRVDFTDKGVCDVCANNDMGQWNGVINTHRWSHLGCNGLGCPYGRCIGDEDIPF